MTSEPEMKQKLAELRVARDKRKKGNDEAIELSKIEHELSVLLRGHSENDPLQVEYRWIMKPGMESKSSGRALSIPDFEWHLEKLLDEVEAKLNAAVDTSGRIPIYHKKAKIEELEVAMHMRRAKYIDDFKRSSGQDPEIGDFTLQERIEREFLNEERKHLELIVQEAVQDLKRTMKV